MNFKILFIFKNHDLYFFRKFFENIFIEFKELQIHKIPKENRKNKKINDIKAKKACRKLTPCRKP